MNNKEQLLVIIIAVLTALFCFALIFCIKYFFQVKIEKEKTKDSEYHVKKVLFENELKDDEIKILQIKIIEIERLNEEFQQKHVDDIKKIFDLENNETKIEKDTKELIENLFVSFSELIEKQNLENNKIITNLFYSNKTQINEVVNSLLQNFSKLQENFVNNMANLITEKNQTSL